MEQNWSILDMLVVLSTVNMEEEQIFFACQLLVLDISVVKTLDTILMFMDLSINHITGLCIIMIGMFLVLCVMFLISLLNCRCLAWLPVHRHGLKNIRDTSWLITEVIPEMLSMSALMRQVRKFQEAIVTQMVHFYILWCRNVIGECPVVRIIPILPLLALSALVKISKLSCDPALIAKNSLLYYIALETVIVFIICSIFGNLF